MSSPLPTPRVPRGRPPTPGRREAILRAAEAVFTRRDYHEVQMDEVAAESGVGKGTLYRYFPGKRALYLAVTFEGIGRLRDALDAAVRTDDPPVRKIERIVRRTLTFFWERRGFFALIHQHEIKPDADVRDWFARRAGLTEVVAGAVREAVAAGELRPIDSRLATEMLFGMMRGVNRYRTREDALDPCVEAVVDVFMRGIATTAGLARLAPAGRQTGSD
jgi:TetR/AcrR family fatty acid metabolism transcriptional regulator